MEITLTPEERERALVLKAAVDRVKAQILADVPSAGSAECGGIFDAYGGAEWKPSRQRGLDFSAWGTWEVWEHQNIVLGSPVPTGDWVAWNSASGQQFGFNSKARYGARRQAEMMAVLWNGAGAKTRVVDAGGGWSASRLNYAGVFTEIKPTVDIVQARMNGSA